MTDKMENKTILPLQINSIPENIREKCEREMQSFDENKKKYTQELKKLLQDDKLATNVNFEEDFLQLYLIHCKNDVSKAFTKLQNYLKFRREYSFFFQAAKFDFPSYSNLEIVTPLPHRHSDGSAILLFQLGKWDPEKIPLETLEQIVYMVFEQLLRHPLTQMNGVHIIHDFTNTGFRHLKFCTLSNMILLNHVSFDVLPVKYAGFHVINGTYLFNILLNLSKPFLAEFFRKIMHIHSSVEELFDYFPHSAIPAQYGGTITDYYMADWLKEANEEHGNFPLGGSKNIFECSQLTDAEILRHMSQKHD